MAREPTTPHASAAAKNERVPSIVKMAQMPPPVAPIRKPDRILFPAVVLNFIEATLGNLVSYNDGDDKLRNQLLYD